MRADPVAGRGMEHARARVRGRAGLEAERIGEEARGLAGELSF